MTANALSLLMLGSVVVQLGILFLILNRLITGHWWARPRSARAISVGFRRLRADTSRLLRRQAGSGDTRATGANSERDLLARLDVAQQNLERADVAEATEALQWFQWEVFKARVQGALSRQASVRLIEEAQKLCEELDARDLPTGVRKPSAAE